MTTQQVEGLVRSIKRVGSDDDATMTAQYVRLSLFIFVVMLGVSIAWATFAHPGGEWESSISDYFHTPARLTLVGTMVAIGVGLMVLYSSNRVENVLLNIAGAFAPVIGFAATTQADGSRRPFDFDVTTDDVDAFATTSLPAYFSALMLLAAFVYVVHPTGTRREKSAMAVGAVLLLALGTWLVWEIWPRKVHVVAAIGFFVPLIILVFATAWSDAVTPRVKRAYLSIGCLMVAAAIWYFVDRSSGRWEYATFFVETVLIGCFGAFWLTEYLRIAARTREE